MLTDSNLTKNDLLLRNIFPDSTYTTPLLKAPLASSLQEVPPAPLGSIHRH